jgi:hypothetical protein
MDGGGETLQVVMVTIGVRFFFLLPTLSKDMLIALIFYD